MLVKTKKRNNKQRLILFFLLAVISLPLVVITVNNRQDIRQRAATANPLAGVQLAFGHKGIPFLETAAQWEVSRPEDAALMRKLAEQPTASWYAQDFTPDVAIPVGNVLGEAKVKNAVPVFVSYSIPKRDCGSYSGGGSTSAANYRNWIDQFSEAITGRAIIIIEPDALTMFDCLSAAEQTERLSLLNYAVSAFKAKGANVYIDAGNARWLKPEVVAERLTQAGIAKADGFALNVSNFFTNEETTIYGNKIAALVGEKHFVIDTSRNGLGPYPPTGQVQWCNPPGRALGILPTTNTGIETIDAYLWIKGPGESDGVCTEFGQNDPRSGTYMPEYALELAQRAFWETVNEEAETTIQPSITSEIEEPEPSVTYTIIGDCSKNKTCETREGKKANTNSETVTDDELRGLLQELIALLEQLLGERRGEDSGQDSNTRYENTDGGLIKRCIDFLSKE